MDSPHLQALKFPHEKAKQEAQADILFSRLLLLST